MTKLYDYWRSSAAYRVRMALNLLGIAYESHPVNLLKAEHRATENTARNPQGLVPTLDIDGITLTQSLAIIEYLNDTRGGLIPTDPLARAHVRALSYAIAMEIAPICNLSVRNHVAALTETKFTADDWQRHYISKGLAAYEAMLLGGSGRFSHGDTVTMADLCLLPQVYNAERVGIDTTSYPQIAEIVKHLRDIPEIAAANPDRVKP